MKTMIAMLTALFVLGLAGCNTIEGAGEDIEAGGEKLQDASKDVKRKM